MNEETSLTALAEIICLLQGQLKAAARKGNLEALTQLFWQYQAYSALKHSVDNRDLYDTTILDNTLKLADKYSKL